MTLFWHKLHLLTEKKILEPEGGPQLTVAWPRKWAGEVISTYWPHSKFNFFYLTLFWLNLHLPTGEILLEPLCGPHMVLAGPRKWAGEVISAYRPQSNLKSVTWHYFGTNYTSLACGVSGCFNVKVNYYFTQLYFLLTILALTLPFNYENFILITIWFWDNKKFILEV